MTYPIYLITVRFRIVSVFVIINKKNQFLLHYRIKLAVWNQFVDLLLHLFDAAVAYLPLGVLFILFNLISIFSYWWSYTIKHTSLALCFIIIVVMAACLVAS